MSQFRRAINIRLPSPGTYVRGVWTAAPDRWETVLASVQPVSNTDVVATTVGEEQSQRVKMYTSSRIGVGHRSWIDRASFEWDGEQWLVESIQVHQMGVIPHYKIIARRIKQ